MLAVQLAHRRLHREGRGGRALGVVRLVQRGTEHRENRVADELVDRSAVRDDDIGHARQVAVQHFHDALGVALLGEPRVAPEIGHEHRDLALVTTEPQALGRLQKSLGHLRGDVATERVPDEVALAEPRDHLVEGARQLADLVARANRELFAEIAAGDARHPSGERADRTGEAPRDEQAQEQRRDRPGDRRLDDRDLELAQALEVEIDRVVHAEHGGGPARRVHDRCDRGDPRAARAAVDARVARDAVLERPAERLYHLRRDRHHLARRQRPVTHDDELRRAPRGIEAGQGPDGRGEQRLGLDGHQRLLDTRVRGRVARHRRLGLGVNRRIDEEHGSPRDVEELRADGVLDLALLALVNERADEPDGDQGQEGEGQGQLDAETLPGAERRPCQISRFADAPSWCRRHALRESPGSRPTTRSSDHGPAPRVSRKIKIEAQVRCSAYALG